MLAAGGDQTGGGLWFAGLLLLLKMVFKYCSELQSQEFLCIWK